MTSLPASPFVNILIVDDDPSTRLAMSELLQAPGLNIIAVGSGLDALRAVLRSDVALILLDVRMPDMDGFETATLIRSLNRSRHVPIVFLTSAAERADWEARGYELGAVDYIVKPCDSDVLKSKVAVFADLHRRNAVLAAQLVRHRSVQHDLELENEHLEEQVRERTASLIEAHHRLRQDMEMRERTEEELRCAKRAAEAANRAKTDFLANISHEIRTPMNAIIGMAQLALQTDLTDEQREYLEPVRAAGDSLLAIVNDVLDITKIEAGHLAIETVPFSLRECVRDAVAMLSFEASTKELALTWDVTPETPDAVVGDPLRLRQIVLNLASNAVKFTEHGGVWIRIRPELTGDGDLCCHISVRDTGAGVPLDLQGAIFEPFQQADASTTRHYGGTGLGLSIAARLVKLMRGRIWLDSCPGQGSTFHCTVRLGLAERGEMDPSHERQRSALDGDLAEADRPAELTVLLVEDNPVNRKLATLVLTKRGHKVVGVDSGRAALEAVGSGRFDVVLMDVQMPEMDGFATTRAIRESNNDLVRQLPVIALTAYALGGDRERCLQAGMDDYLVKPIQPAALLDAVERVQRARARTRSAAALGETHLGPLSGPEEALLDPEVAAEILALFDRECPRQLAALKEAVDATDSASFATSLHTLRGMLQSLAAPFVDHLAARLEALRLPEERTQAHALLSELEEGAAQLRAQLVDLGAAAASTSTAN
jgi:signal transduction histidine kinase/HPt (histidine-containing phosphotransfer) domain-containing protein